MPLPVNWSQVADNLYRSGRPEYGDYLDIEKRGVVAIVNLEGAEQAAEELSATVLQQLWFPIDFDDIYLTGVPKRLFDSLLSWIRAKVEAGQKVLVHCQHGQDRTGAVIAAYRMKYEGWSYELAVAEAISFGYRQVVNRGLDSLLEQYKVKP